MRRLRIKTSTAVVTDEAIFAGSHLVNRLFSKGLKFGPWMIFQLSEWRIFPITEM